MEFALVNAFQEITLVLFTTLAPAAVVACLVAAAPLLKSNIDDDVRYSLAKAFSAPLIVATGGLIASATHLGDPSNALYVFAGVGRSPLSNEVVAAVAFLVCAGTFWVASFSRKHHVILIRAWYVVAVVVGALFICAVAFAYNVETIITWYIIYVPISILLNVTFMGPILGLTTLQLSKWKSPNKTTRKVLLVVASVAFILSTINYALFGASVLEMGNAFFSVRDLVPFYWVGLGVFVILGASALVLMMRSDRLIHAIVACVIGFAAIFIMRFLFYMTHITAGVGI